MNFEEILFGLLVVVIILTIVMIVKKHNKRNKKKKKEKIESNYAMLAADRPNEYSENILNFAETEQKLRALDNFMIGATYLVNYGNPDRALNFFNLAIGEINDRIEEDGKMYIEDVYVLNRIEDFNALFMPEFKLIEHNTQTFSPQLEIDPNNENYNENKVLKNIIWHSDSQNVHDRVIMDDLYNQYSYISTTNPAKPDSYINFKCFIIDKTCNDKEKHAKVLKVLAILDNDFPIQFIPGVREQEFVSVIWERINDPINEKNRENLKDSLINSVLDCVEGGYVVCPGGRPHKLWQTFSTLDANDQIGVLKTKEVIRNEIISKCGSISKKYTGPDSDTPKNVLDDYNNDVDTQEVIDLKKKIEKEMLDIKSEYDYLTPDMKIQQIIDLCISQI